jgi:hypothetical protein
MRGYTECWLKILKGRNHLEDLGIEGRIVLKLIYRNLPEHRDVWWVLVNKMINENEVKKPASISSN